MNYPMNETAATGTKENTISKIQRSEMDPDQRIIKGFLRMSTLSKNQPEIKTNEASTKNFFKNDLKGNNFRDN